MSATLVADGVLVLLLLGLALRATAAADAFAAVVAFVAFGLLLALAWMRLHAGDVALTEAAIGSGVTGAVLVAAAMRLPPTLPHIPPEADPEAAFPKAMPGGAARPEVMPGWAARPKVILGEAAIRLAALLLSGLVTACLAGLVLWTTGPSHSQAATALRHLPELGLYNAVTGVLMAYRGFDTLMEKIVLLLALVGVWSLARDTVWGGRPFPAAIPAQGGAVTLIARLLPPIGIVVAVYLLWVSAEEPGGAFQGGAILAAMWLLVLLAGLRQAPLLGSRLVRWTVAVGPAIFLAAGFAGFAFPAGFLSYPPGVAKAMIILIEFPLLLSIAVILGLLVTGPAERRP
ncbi:hydrogenase subunit MbhD domain-containing protein [Rhodopila sp.]|uniref:hydrogenase subunit MbhD domain-containing protein n=1 Tax=Rhodopila sp. TaxID=2480087 RepID=UPI002B6EF318|nr:hydrogenase subunit MbhD domain-containing protein [Rhodopila sp.]HVZ08595.1 hydrogenase subunit MbhD domain-containing protein [Rhodopila sp.]